MNISVIPGQDSNCIIVDGQTHGEWGQPDRINLHFGKFHKSMAVAVDDRITDTIFIPGKLSAQVTVPDLPYEVRLNGQALHLGPVIGLMNVGAIYKDPEIIKTRFSRYNEIQGLIFIFTKNTIGTKDQLIQGKYYDPKTDSFIEATVPYPSVIYLRANPSPKLYRHLEKKLGARNIYNYPFRSDKLVFWQLASQDPGVRSHLPDTQEYVTPADAVEMLRKHGTVYLKPNNWSRGRGIYRLSWEENCYLLSDIHGDSWTAWETSALEDLLREKLCRKYLIQQEILFRYQEHKVDFRIYLQKDIAMQWKCRWIDTRVSVKGSIISNYSHRHKVLTGEEGLTQIFGLSMVTAEKKIKEITQICSRALKTMEDNGHSLGDVAIDLVIDSNLKVWLLEVQPDYYCEGFKIDMYLAHMHYISLDYAKALTGHKEHPTLPRRVTNYSGFRLPASHFQHSGSCPPPSKQSP